MISTLLGKCRYFVQSKREGSRYLQTMINPVVGHFCRVFLEAVHSTSFHAIHQIHLAIRLRNVSVVDLLLFWIQFVLDRIVVRTREVPRSHCEVLQHFQTIGYSFLDSYHSVEKNYKVNLDLPGFSMQNVLLMETTNTG